MGILHVRLVPPQNPLPEISKEIGLLDRKHSEQIQTGIDALQAAYERQLSKAKASVVPLVHAAFSKARSDMGATSFAVMGEEALSRIRINVQPDPMSDPLIIQKIKAVEARLATEDALVVKQAIAEMEALTSIVLSELKAELRAKVDFGANQRNNRLFATGFFAHRCAAGSPFK